MDNNVLSRDDREPDQGREGSVRWALAGLDC